ncbi:MAG: hypothetical protein ACJ8AG_07835 [Ktedonobacteraceae bacterium]
MPDKKHHEHPTREARHELPGGKQGEDKHEQGKEEPGQALVRHLPGGGLSGTAVVSRIGPSVTSMSATKSAIRSEDLRQTMSTPTAKHPTMMASVSATV